MVDAMYAPKSVDRVVQVDQNEEGQGHTDECKSREIENLNFVSRLPFSTYLELTAKSCQRNKKRCAVKNFGTFFAAMARTVLYAFGTVSLGMLYHSGRAHRGVIGLGFMSQHVYIIHLKCVGSNPIDDEHPRNWFEPVPINFFIYNIV